MWGWGAGLRPGGACEPTKKVLPSGCARATMSPAIMPAAPPLLSMTMGAPSAAETSWATSRVIWSAAPPAGEGTTNRVGGFCANAAVAAASAKASQTSGAKGRDARFMGVSPGERSCANLHTPIRDHGPARMRAGPVTFLTCAFLPFFLPLPGGVFLYGLPAADPAIGQSPCGRAG